ncbi:MAG: response regulator [Gammaproteobacteria bacterium]|jgi:two-component system invasion response regulator UvrY|nr:response regulator [Gammaproteobacteria bacterium]MBT3722176.1 response regulator [Gammaproteobacteria bacterium]MBT4078064.1 response regulator [Gammaproteobacteria bacterium]MBT4193493.1 response regulator [Gammaproteobacteria bacterium]MBT4452154.1 response regulator [Gammaproteobacteria bacterium]
MIKVLLTDDHALVRTGIKRLLEDSQQVEIIGEADSGEASLILSQELNPDVILMDVNMPGIGGVEASRRILQRDPEQKIIILTIHTEQTFPKRLLEIGAKGYLTKECNINEMILAIKQVNNGGSYIEPRIAQQLALSLLPGNSENPVDKLSRREFQVMLMISHGLSNIEISEKLCLSPKTVSTYRSRLLEKLNAHNEVDLIKIAVEQGMVEFSQSEQPEA